MKSNPLQLPAKLKAIVGTHRRPAPVSNEPGATTALMLLLGIAATVAFDNPAAAQQPPAGTPPATQQQPAAPPVPQPPATRVAPSTSAPAAAQTLGAAELDQLFAPIALYPDDLIAQILAASTYPLEIVMAARWIAEPNNAALKGDALEQAVQAQGWDPAVKSLVVFPSVLKTMSTKLDWTQKLGDAFLAQQADCMASIQRLRARASGAGKLTTTAQQKVTTQGDTIVIEPANPQVVYVPAYDPGVVYGAWPYPGEPPYAFPPPVGYGVAAGLATGLAFGAGVAIANSWWNWGRVNWAGGNINVNVNQFNRINANRGAIVAGNTWQHNSVHRQGVAYRDAGTRARFAGNRTAGGAARQNFRGHVGHGGAAAVHAGAAGRVAAGHHVAGGGRVAAAHHGAAGGRVAAARGGGRPAVHRASAPAFHMGNGAQTRAFAQRGAGSRQAAGFHRGGGGFSAAVVAVASIEAAVAVASTAVAVVFMAGADACGEPQRRTRGVTVMSSRRLGLAVLAMATAIATAPIDIGRIHRADALAQAARPAALATGQREFGSPEEAAAALTAAAKEKKEADLLAIFGREAEPLLSSGDPVADAAVRERFVADYDAAHRLDQSGDKAVLVIGKEDWPFPIPLKREGDKWRFDTAAGQEEIIDRRIGENELSAIQTMLAYVDAQIEYAEAQQATGPAIYAQRIRSTPGRHDGLYWPTAEGEKPSPLGPLVADARAEGYRAAAKEGERVPYHGYFYKILTAQGPDASGGALNYIVNGRMIGGFGMVAWPARYGASGIMTFIVNHEGVVYEKNLGSKTAAVASTMTRFEPDKGWRKVEP